MASTDDDRIVVAAGTFRRHRHRRRRRRQSQQRRQGLSTNNLQITSCHVKSHFVSVNTHKRNRIAKKLQKVFFFFYCIDRLILSINWDQLKKLENLIRRKKTCLSFFLSLFLKQKKMEWDRFYKMTILYS